MSKIWILPEEIRSKIAAGEVIERPASVIKELVENAFDAKATFIKLEFDKGGLERIAVYDNGIGMSPEDLKLCYKSFATSKIKGLEDLYKISTYGFRGEALASIAQVSRLRIVSLERGGLHPYEIEVEFGKEKAFKPSKLKEGTLVEVRDLFENLPARRAFIKSPRAESAKNVEIFRALLLTHPEIKAKLVIDGKEVFSFEGENLKELFSKLFDLEEDLLFESTFERPPYKVELLLTDTRKTFSHGRFLFFLVNQRLVKDERLSGYFFSLLKKFFGALGFPAGVVKIFSPPQLLDFNVHPAKWEVRFKREKELFETLYLSLENHFKIKKFYFYERVPKEPSEVIKDTKVKEDLPLEYSFQKESSSKPTFFEEKVPFFKIHGAFKDTYLLVEKENELYIVDQHALSERIHYEKLKRKGFLPFPQKLLLPFLIKLTPEMFENLEEKLEILSQLGFEVEVVGREELIVKGVPSQVKEFAKETLETLLSLPEPKAYEAYEVLLKDLACRLARKKGDYLSEEEKRYLLETMFKEGLETCPHGRPLFIKLDLSEIEKRLKRRV